MKIQDPPIYENAETWLNLLTAYMSELNYGCIQERKTGRAHIDMNKEQLLYLLERFTVTGKNESARLLACRLENIIVEEDVGFILMSF
jgi:hypothetical protein